MANTLAIRPANITSLSLKIFPASTTRINTKADTNSSPATLPERKIFLFGKIIDDLYITQFLPITIEKSDDLYIASDDIFGVYGDGDTEGEALEDYRISLLDYYQLVEIQGYKDDQNQALFHHLKLYISHSTK